MATRHGTGRAVAAAHLFGEEERTAKAAAEAGEGTDEALLGRLRLGQPRLEGGLEVVPLGLDGGGGEPPVLLTGQAVEAGALEIVERGEGVVQELLAWNRGEKPVAILEGDTLVGCKQNRVVAHSVIVAPGTRLGVPVGCMERGRWRHATPSFAVGDTKISPGVRRRTVADVKAATLAGRVPTLVQSRLWADVEHELAAACASSPTSDYLAVAEVRGRDARAGARRLAPEPGEVGAIVLADGALVGFEATGHDCLWSALAGPTLASYLMGGHGEGTARGARATAAEWLARVRQAELRTRRGLGLGLDLDLRGPHLSGVGLALGAFTVHVAVFAA